MSGAEDEIRADGGAETEAGAESERGADAVDLARYRARRIRERLLARLDAIHAAIERRDLDRVLALLDEEEAYRFVPATVRREAITMAQLPPASLRAPIQLFRYEHLLRRLGDEPMEATPDAVQLALDLAPPAPPAAATEGSARELPFRALPFRDRRSPHGSARFGGRDRRRSGSR
jgi:hypothetical protein